MQQNRSIYFYRFIALFSGLFILSFDFSYALNLSPYPIVGPLFESLVELSAHFIFGFEIFTASSISSDSVELYIATFNNIILAIFFTLLWNISRKEHPNFILWTRTSITYYLALQLLLYGFAKIFKAQFYLAEPNTLFTPLGNLSPDIAYWSAIGSSWWYSFLIGLSEVLVAILLLFKNTRLLGSIFGFLILSHILCINIGFDISVKVYSTFLLFLFTVLLSPHFRYLYRTLILKKSVYFHPEKSLLGNSSNKKLPFILKGMLVIIFIIVSIYPYISKRNWNDDMAERPLFHGAYEVKSCIINGDTMVANKSISQRWERVFIHRRGYFILQNMQDKMQDYLLEIDTTNCILKLENYTTNAHFGMHYTAKNKRLKSIKGRIEGQQIQVELEQIDIEKLPFRNSSIHWTTKH